MSPAGRIGMAKRKATTNALRRAAALGTIHEKGRAAFAEGQTIMDCPYRKFGPWANEWRAGWRDAATDAKYAGR
jgi:ribosome modulation factor